MFGYSSGAILALKAAAAGLPVTKLVLYEPPFNPDDSHPVLPARPAGQLAELVSAGRRGDAVELYQTTAVGIPADVAAQMRHAPFRPGHGGDRPHPRLRCRRSSATGRCLPAARLGHRPGPGESPANKSPPFLRGAAQTVASRPCRMGG